MATYNTPSGNQLDFLWLIVKALEGSGGPGGGGPTASAIGTAVASAMKGTPAQENDLTSETITLLAAAIAAAVPVPPTPVAPQPTVGSTFSSETIAVGVSSVQRAGGAAVLGWQLTNHGPGIVYYAPGNSVSASSARLQIGGSQSLNVSGDISVLASAANTMVSIVRVTQ